MKLVLLFLMLAVSGVSAEDKFIAVVSKVEGTVTALRKGASDWKNVVGNDSFSAGDIIKTGEDARCEVYLIDGTIFEVGPSSTLKIQEISGEKEHLQRAILDLEMGNLLSEIEKGLDYRVRTPQAVCAVRGTKFDVDTGRDKLSRVAVFKGEVAVSNYEKSGRLSKVAQIVKKMQETHVRLYKKPVLKKKLSRRMREIRSRMLKERARRKKLKKKIAKRRKILLEKRKKKILKRNRKRKRELIKNRKHRRKPVLRSPGKIK